MNVLRTITSGIGQVWARGCLGKGIVVFVAVIVLGMCGSLLGGNRTRPAAGGVPTTLAAAAVPTTAPEPTAVPEPTIAPEPTTAPEPTIAAVPSTAAPTADTPAARYIAIAQAGVTIRSVRPGDMPKGAWKADVVDIGNGPEVTMTMPVGIGLSTAQMLRQAKRQVAQAVKAVFDADPAVARVTVTGTLPDGSDKSELGAVSIFVTRAAYTRWDGTAENLGDWRIPPRYR